MTKISAVAMLLFSISSVSATEAIAMPPTEGLGVEAAGIISEMSGNCPERTIVVRGVPVLMTTTTVFEEPLSCGSLAVDQRVRVKAHLTHDGTDYRVAATYVAAVDATGGAGKKASGIGVVGAITGGCPTLGLVITGTKVSTTVTTEYENGTCESLRPGTQVTIDGELRPGGTAIAERIQIRRVPGRPVAGDGMVSAVTGTCPALTMTVRGVPVVTSGATTFTGGTCDSVIPGTHIDVTGDYDGTTVTATAVAIRNRSHQ